MSLENWSPYRRKSVRPSAQRQLEDRLRAIAPTAVLGANGPSDHRVSRLAVVPTNNAEARADRQAEAVRQTIREREMRGQFFPAEFCVDPAWGMLLHLYLARLESRLESASGLPVAAAIPVTTALRWIATMAKAKLVIRKNDPDDGRRSFVIMTDTAFDAMTRYFEMREA